ncbi:MAG: 30S ribosomal protein S17 [Tepidiformaceae bacterium]
MTQRILEGFVVSDKMDKTVVVNVSRRKQHPRYKKVITRHSKYQAHDEVNNCAIGDLVRIQECRPISKSKRWRVIEIVRRGDIAEISPADIGREIEEGKQDEVEEVGSALEEETTEDADVVEEVES